jgi:hypothetical protein
MHEMATRPIFIVLLFMAVVLSGCKTEIVGPLQEFEQPFWIGISESTVLLPDGLRITFDDVLEDSRCPADVVCVWEGRARGRFELQHDSFDKVQLDLILSGYVAKEDTLQHVPKDTLGYIFTFMQLDPYPLHRKPHKKKDYRAFVRVAKGTLQ